MTFFCKNAQEEALKIIARQMMIDNEFKILHELRQTGAISEDNYIEMLRRLEKNIYK